MIGSGTETSDVKTSSINDPAPNDTDVLLNMPVEAGTGNIGYDGVSFPPMGLVGTETAVDPAGMNPLFMPMGSTADLNGFTPSIFAGEDPNNAMGTTYPTFLDSMLTPNAPLELPVFSGVSSMAADPYLASIGSTSISTSVFTPMPMMLPTTVPVMPIPMSTMPAPTMNTTINTGYSPLGTMPPVTATPTAIPTAEPTAEPTAIPTAPPSGGGGTASNGISSMWNIQFQGSDGLDTYGDSEGENDYSEIPAESYSENSDGSLTLSSNGDDEGSANSQYPRTELREKEEWEIMTGSHKMSAEYTDISGGRQTIMQIHFSDNAEHPDEPPIRLEMIDGELVIETRQTAGMDGSESTSLGSVPLPTAGSPLNIEMEVVDGTVQVIVNGEVMYEEALDWDGEGESAYFKAGTYNHSGGDTSVTMSSMDVSHS